MGYLTRPTGGARRGLPVVLVVRPGSAEPFSDAVGFVREAFGPSWVFAGPAAGEPFEGGRGEPGLSGLNAHRVRGLVEGAGSEDVAAKLAAAGECNLRRDPSTGSGGAVYVDTDAADRGPEYVFVGGFFVGTDYHLLRTEGFGTTQGEPGRRLLRDDR